jgi:hypothetical protein
MQTLEYTLGGAQNHRSAVGMSIRSARFAWHRIFRRFTTVFACALLAAAFLSGCSFTPSASSPTSVPNGVPRVITSKFPTEDLVVASFVATDPPYLADPTGQRDATIAIQQALDDCHRVGGGVVWLPAGKYKVTSSIFIPEHVTLRGDWRDPDAGKGSYGAVIMAGVPTGPADAPGLFRISGSAGVNGLTVYYPNQSIIKPIPYPYTFEILGRLLSPDGYMMATVEHVTLLDSYRGISAGARATHELHTIRNVKGTTLATGLYLQDSADVSTNDDITLTPTYWATLDASVAPNHPSRGAIAAWTQANGVGMQMGGLDWDQFTNLTFSDDHVGIEMMPGRRQGMTASLFGITVQHSAVAMRIDGTTIYSGFGLNIANSSLQADVGADAVAVQVYGDNHDASVLFNHVTFAGAFAAVQVTGNDFVELMQCLLDSWSGPAAITASNGTLAVEGSTFAQPLTDAHKGISLQHGLSSATIIGNTYTGVSQNLLDSTASGVIAPDIQVERNDHHFPFTDSGITTYSFHDLPRPTSTRLINVKDAPYLAQTNGNSDDTAAIQHALNDAGTTGGIVYLPPGIYPIRGHLVVPAGVEMRGSDDMPHRAMTLDGATGTILFAYAGRDTATPESDAPLIFLDGDRAGVRGIGIHYPEQPADSPSHIVPYPWSIRGKGTGVYALDIALTNAYQGIDFATYATDDHYIGNIEGFALRTGIKVGQSKEGWIEHVRLNINAWARAEELPDQLDAGQLFPVAAAYSQMNEQGFVVGQGAMNEHLTDDFLYGAHTGYTFTGNARVSAINIGADGTANTVIANGSGDSQITLINAQGCGCQLKGVGLTINGGHVTVFNLLTLVDYDAVALITGGTYMLAGAAFQASSASVTGGTGTIAGTWFEASGVQVEVSGAKTMANLWGNVGTNGFHVSFANGAPSRSANNIPRD